MTLFLSLLPVLVLSLADVRRACRAYCLPMALSAPSRSRYLAPLAYSVSPALSSLSSSPMSMTQLHSPHSILSFLAGAAAAASSAPALVVASLDPRSSPSTAGIETSPTHFARVLAAFSNAIPSTGVHSEY